MEGFFISFVVLLVISIPLIIFFIKCVQIANQGTGTIEGAGVSAEKFTSSWKEPAPFAVQLSVSEATKTIAASLPKFFYANGTWQILNVENKASDDVVQLLTLENGSSSTISCNIPCLDESDPTSPERLDLGLIITVLDQNPGGNLSTIKLHFISYEGSESKLEAIATSTAQYLDRTLRQNMGSSSAKSIEPMPENVGAGNGLASVSGQSSAAQASQTQSPQIQTNKVQAPPVVLTPLVVPPAPPAIIDSAAADTTDASSKEFFAKSADYSADFFSAAKSSAAGYDPIAAADPVAAPVPVSAPDPQAAPVPRAALDPLAAPDPFMGTAADPLAGHSSFSPIYPVAPPLPVAPGGAGLCPGCSQPINPSFPFCLYCGKNL